MEQNKAYAFQVKLDLPYNQAVQKTTEALKEQGFDVQATLKEKLDVDFRKYVILGACNPPLAHRALIAELEVGLLLPCNVIVYEQEGGSIVSILDPLVMIGIADNPHLDLVAQEAKERVQRVVAALSA